MSTLLYVHIVYYNIYYMAKKIKYSCKGKKCIKCGTYHLPQDISLGICIETSLKTNYLSAR